MLHSSLVARKKIVVCLFCISKACIGLYRAIFRGCAEILILLTTLTSNHTSYQLCQLGNNQEPTFVWLLVSLSIFVCCQFLKNRKIILLEFQLILTTERISNWKGQASQKAEEETFLRIEIKKYNEELKFITISSSGILFLFGHSSLDMQCICICLIRYSHSEANPRNK